MRLLEVRHVLDLKLHSRRYLKPVLALLPVALMVAFLQVPLKHIMYAAVASEVAVIIGMFFVIAICYLFVLYMLGIEEEDINVWRELRLQRTA